MFPGRLFHQTSPNKDTEDKVTLGANYFLKGEIGQYKDTDLITL